MSLSIWFSDILLYNPSTVVEARYFNGFRLRFIKEIIECIRNNFLRESRKGDGCLGTCEGQPGKEKVYLAFLLIYLFIYCQ